MTAPRPDTWMPLYVGDYLRDTGHLSAAQHGAYLLLIMHYWTTGAPLPDDDAALWRIARADSLAHWRKVLRPVVGLMFAIAGGLWRHKRIDAELAWARAYTSAKAEAGAKGAAKRWQKDGRPNGTAMAQPSVCQWQTDAPSPSHIDIDPSGSISAPATPAPRAKNPLEIDDEFRAWAAQHCPDVNLETELARHVDWKRAKGKSFRDPRAAFRNWCRTAAERTKPNGQHNPAQPRFNNPFAQILHEQHVAGDDRRPAKLGDADG